MNMVGHPKHVDKACAVGVDIICAQGGEAGGHTGTIATICLVPQCVDKCRGRTSPMTGGPVHVVAAGGIYDGRTVAAALSLGAEAVWVGTRFLASEEATATKIHKQGVVGAGPGDMIQSLHFSGRPCRMLNTQYVQEWNGPRATERDSLLAQGKVPLEVEMRNVARATRKGETPRSPAGLLLSPIHTQPLFMGQVSGAIAKVEPVAAIMAELVAGAAKVLKVRAGMVTIDSRM